MAFLRMLLLLLSFGLLMQGSFSSSPVVPCPEYCECTDLLADANVTCKNPADEEFALPNPLPEGTTYFSWNDESENGSSNLEIGGPSWSRLRTISITTRNENTILAFSRPLSLPNLTHFGLHLKAAFMQEDDTMYLAAMADTQLKVLDLSECHRLRFPDVGALKDYLPSTLEVFRGGSIGTWLPRSPLDDIFFKSFSHTRLKEIHLPSSNVYEVAGPGGTHVPMLEVLNLSDNLMIVNNSNATKQMFSNTNLRVLDMSKWNTQFSKEEVCSFLVPPFWAPTLTNVILDYRVFKIPMDLDEGVCEFGNNSIQSYSLKGAGFRIFDVELRGLENLLSLDLSDSGIEFLSNRTLRFMPSLQILNLSHNRLFKMQEHFMYDVLFINNRNLSLIDISFNGLTKLPSSLLSMFEYLEVLNVSHNNLLYVCPLFDLLTNIPIINASSNRITGEGTCFAGQSFFNKSSSSESNHTLDLTQNPLVCNCSTLLFVKWVQFPHGSVNLVERTSLSCRLGSATVAMTNVRAREIEATCDSDSVPPLTTLLIPLACSLAVAVSTITVVVTRRRSTRQKTIRSMLRAARWSDKEVGFLGFMSYSSADHNVVTNQIWTTLEGKLQAELNTDRKLIFIDERDFSLGVHLTDNIIRAVRNCPVVILTISSSFLESHWCGFETEVAIMEGKYIILIFLETIDLSRIPSSLKKVYKRWTRISWPGDTDARKLENFWKRLVSSMISLAYKHEREKSCTQEPVTKNPTVNHDSQDIPLIIP